MQNPWGLCLSGLRRGDRQWSGTMHVKITYRRGSSCSLEWLREGFPGRATCKLDKPNQSGECRGAALSPQLLLTF